MKVLNKKATFIIPIWLLIIAEIFGFTALMILLTLSDYAYSLVNWYGYFVDTVMYGMSIIVIAPICYLTFPKLIGDKANKSNR